MVGVALLVVGAVALFVALDGPPQRVGRAVRIRILASGQVSDTANAGVEDGDVGQSEGASCDVLSYWRAEVRTAPQATLASDAAFVPGNRIGRRASVVAVWAVQDPLRHVAS